MYSWYTTAGAGLIRLVAGVVARKVTEGEYWAFVDEYEFACNVILFLGRLSVNEWQEDQVMNLGGHVVWL